MSIGQMYHGVSSYVLRMLTSLGFLTTPAQVPNTSDTTSESPDAMSTRLSEPPQVGETWIHYKGNKYVILGQTFEADGPKLVLRVRYGFGPGGVEFNRRLDNFLEFVPGHGPRFVLCDE